MPPTKARGLVREACVFFAFAALTVAMTWPWAAHFRDAAADAGDSYFNAWILWWNFHQTFHDPLHLFDANLFYPLKTTLAFGEHDFGIAVPFFPLFALGVRPLTVQSLATLLGFVLSGYGAFRLARTLTGSQAAGWVGGVAFAFTPVRFHELPHLDYLWAGWMPLLFEALVLFVRERTWRRAAWLGAVFLLNGLCVTWLLLTALPLALAAALLVVREGAARDPALWRRGGAALGIASLLLLPFLVPYLLVARRYGFERSFDETLGFSARLVDWVSVDLRNRFWRSLGMRAAGEMLFPGLLMPLLALAAPLRAKEGTHARGSDGSVVGLVLFVTGFLGSFGLRFPLHRLLWEVAPVFRAIRVPARWGMVAHLGLALLAAVGFARVLERLSRRVRLPLAVAVLLAFLLELRAAPLGEFVIHGAVEPDEVSLFLKRTPMKGGLVALPSGGDAHGNFEWVLRAADHGKPLVNAFSSFQPPHVAKLEELARRRPVAPELLDHLESIPTSYLLVRESWLTTREREVLRPFLARGLREGRLVFVKRFGGERRDDLYAVSRTEPDARPMETLPWKPGEVVGTSGPEDESLLGSVDEPAEGSTVRGELTVRGWAQMPGDPLAVTITIDGEARRPTSFTRTARPDVLAVFPQMKDVRTAGYEARFEPRAGDDGVHEVCAIFQGAKGRVRHYPERRFTWRR